MLFYYKAKKLTGEGAEGEKEAQDEFELAKILKDEGYILIYFKERHNVGKTFYFLNSILKILNFNTVPISEKMIFTRNLAVMISAGITLSHGLETLSKQTQNKKLKEILISVAEEIKKGKSFSESIALYPKVFSPIFVAMTKAGEKTGNLEESLKILGHQLKRDYDLKKRIKSALMYPAIVISAMILIGIIMMIYVVPTLISTFKELGAELPFTTKIFIKTSNFLVNDGVIALIMIIVILIVSVFLYSQPQTKKIFHFSVLRLPIISPLIKKVNTARAARTLGSLIGSGVSILEALAITEEVLQNFYYKKTLNEAKGKIEKGEQISEIFKSHPELYPAIMSEMTSVGEETGKISDMLIKIASFYENEVAVATKDLSTIIEPVLMVIIGAAVGFFAISMLQPMYGMMQNV